MKIRQLTALLAAPLLAMGMSSVSAQTVADLHKKIDALHADAQKVHVETDKLLGEIAKHASFATHHKAHKVRRDNRGAQRRKHHADHKAKACATVPLCQTEAKAAEQFLERAKKHHAEVMEHHKLIPMHDKINALHLDLQKLHVVSDKHLTELAKHAHLATHHKGHHTRRHARGALRKAHHAAHHSAGCSTMEACTKHLAELQALHDRAVKHNAEMLEHLKIPAPKKP